MPVYNVLYVFQDDQGRETGRQVLFDVADEATLLTDAAAMRTDLLAFTKCAIPRYTYSLEVTPGGVPEAGSNIDAGATFTWVTTLPIAPTTKIPDPAEAIKDGQGGINLLATIVTDYTDNYTLGSARLNRNNPTQPTAVRRAVLDK